MNAVISFPAGFSSIWPIDYCLPKPPRCAKTPQSHAGAAAGAETPKPRSAGSGTAPGEHSHLISHFGEKKLEDISTLQSASTTLVHNPVLLPRLDARAGCSRAVLRTVTSSLGNFSLIAAGSGLEFVICKHDPDGDAGYGACPGWGLPYRGE